MKPFESILAKARKLAALADPANNPEPAEREAAAARFEEYTTRHGITADALDENKREWRTILARAATRASRRNSTKASPPSPPSAQPSSSAI